MILRYLLLITFLACLYTTVGGRDKESMDIIKANYYYDHLAFGKAIPYYEKVITENDNAQIYFRLGDCYRLTGDISLAADNYEKALKKQMFGNVTMLRYGQVLMQLQRYDEAAKWLKEYQKTNLGDKRVANLIAGCSTAPELLKKNVGANPTLLPFNTDKSEFAPVLWQGNLVFTSDTAISVSKKKSSWSNSSFCAMYCIPCDDAGNCGDAPVSLTTHGDISWHDGPCTFSGDGDTMYYTRTKCTQKFLGTRTEANSTGTVVLETMIATDYDESTHRFQKTSKFVFSSRNYAVVHPTVSPDGRHLVFSSTMMGSGSDLYMCTRNKKGKWLRPQNLGAAVNTEGEEVFPFFANDSTLFFASDGHKGFGGLDIYLTRYNKVKNTFSEPEHMDAPINSSYDDISMAMSADGTGGYFSSNRPADKGGDNIYFYRKGK